MERVPGMLIAGKYRLDRPFGRGGMGAVWVAHHTQLGADVALKFMDASLVTSSDARARFEREARAAAQIDSPNVVRIYDHGIDEGAPFMVMELLRGTDLGARLRDEPMDIAEVGSLCAQMARALRRAHERGIVHRDLKPANVFLVHDDGEIFVKILDFGVAKFVGKTDEADAAEVTHTGDVVGSPQYMSPEQARGLKSVDHRTDLWSLGVILYRALTQHRLFEGASAGDVIVRVCTDPIPPPSTFVPALGPRMDAFFVRALARDPARRFSSAQELLAAFKEALPASAQLGAAIAAPITAASGVMSDPPGTLARAVTSAPIVSQPSRSGVPRWVFVAGSAALGAALAIGLFALRSDTSSGHLDVAPSPATSNTADTSVASSSAAPSEIAEASSSSSAAPAPSATTSAAAGRRPTIAPRPRAAPPPRPATASPTADVPRLGI